MSLLHWLKQRANRDLKLISNQDTLSVLIMSCQPTIKINVEFKTDAIAPYIKWYNFHD